MATETNKQTLLLYAGLIIIAGFVVGYLGYSQFVQPGEPVPAPAPISSKDNLKSFQNLKINFAILDSSAYKSLQTFGELPVNPGVTGKKDLFAP